MQNRTRKEVAKRRFSEEVSRGKVPVVVYNRGGNGNYGGLVFNGMFKHLFPLADKGFLIIGSQYRGTFMKDVNASFDNQFGGADVADVLELFNIIPNIKIADSTFFLGMITA